MLDTIPWYVLALGGALFLALSEVVGKKVMFHEHALEFLTMRSSFMLLLVVTLIPFVEWEALTLPIILFIYVISLMLTAALLYRMKALRHLEVSYVGPLMNLSPLLLLVVAFVFLGERITGMQFLGILAMLIGTYTLQGREHGSLLAPLKKMLSSRHVHYLLFAISVLSLTGVLEKYTITFLGVPPLTHLFVVWLCIGANLLVLDWFRFGLEDIRRDARRDAPWVFSSAALFFLSVVFGLLSIAAAPVSLVIPLRRTSALFSITIGGRLFHERNLMRKLVAAGLMVLGTALIIA